MGHGPTGALGDRAEQHAYRFLIDRGLRPVARNFHTRGGEIDLVMLDQQCLVFVEVRYRQSTRFTEPGLTVDRHKQRKIIRTAAIFSARNRALANHVMRFDIVAIEGSNPPTTKWIKDAFRPGDSTF